MTSSASARLSWGPSPPSPLPVHWVCCWSTAIAPSALSNSLRLEYNFHCHFSSLQLAESLCPPASNQCILRPWTSRTCCINLSSLLTYQFDIWAAGKVTGQPTSRQGCAKQCQPRLGKAKKCDGCRAALSSKEGKCSKVSILIVSSKSGRRKKINNRDGHWAEFI